MAGLAIATVTAPDVAPERWMLFLHGIFGSGANWRTFARRLVAAHPEWGGVLVDLRGHGASQGMAPPHTVDAAATDLEEVARQLPTPVGGVLGHSFGGKVALAYLERCRGALDVAWVLDSTPSARPDRRGGGTIEAVLAALEALPPLLPTRTAFVDSIAASGVDPSLHAWLAMNVRPSGDRFSLRLDLPMIRALLDDYWRRDLWSVVERPVGRASLHLVVGGRSPVFDADDRARAKAAAEASAGRVQLHVLPEAGHWVHVDEPDALFTLVSSALAEIY